MILDAIVAVFAAAVATFAMFPARRLTGVARAGDRTLSIVIPARNEERNVGELIDSINTTLDIAWDVIVVDDGSVDATGDVARQHGATVVRIDDLPAGWSGKAHACWRGAEAARGDVILFVDADVRFESHASTFVSAALGLIETEPDRLISAQPWHTPKSFGERLSLTFNVVSVMASRCRGLWHSRRPLVFGPFVMCDAQVYRSLGGHGHESVRSSVVEDIALGRLFRKVDVTMAPADALTFRMYPSGARGVIAGFTKNLGSAAGTSSPLAMVAVVSWFVFLCSPLTVSPIMYPVCVAHVAVMAHSVGRFQLIDAMLYPIHLVVFVMVQVRSAWRRWFVGSVAWSGRRIEI